MIPTMRLVINNGSPLWLNFVARPDKDEHENEKADRECDKKKIVHKIVRRNGEREIESSDRCDRDADLRAYWLFVGLLAERKEK